VRAAIECGRLVRALKPKSLALVGIAGSLEPKRLCLGDVVVPDLVYGYTTGAVDDSGRSIERSLRRAGAPVAANLVRGVKDFTLGPKYFDWQVEGRRHAKELGLRLSAGRPRIHMGEVLASGTDVVRSTDFVRILRRDVDQRVSAVAMEEIGCAEAIDGLDARAGMLVIRGISDYADGRKASLEKKTKDRWRRFAAANAARLWRDLTVDLGESSVHGDLRVSMERGTIREFDADFSELLLERQGVQHLVFPRLLLFDVAPPPLRLVVTATAGQSKDIEVRLKIKDALQTLEPSGSGGPQGRVFELSAVPKGARVTLAIRSETRVDAVEVKVEDYFGRTLDGDYRPCA
jgi:nucleoside phosphorylase